MNEQHLDIIRDNLTDTASDAIGSLERRLAHLSELAKMLCDDVADFSFILSESFLSRYREAREQMYGDLEKQVIPENRAALLLYSGAQRMADKIYLCRAITDICRKKGLKTEKYLSYLKDAQDDTRAAKGRVAYLKNAYTSAAYDRFSLVLRDLSPSYCTDFNAVCEEVYYSRAEMCILPIETSNDGVLSVFWQLMRKYDLSIIMSCEIESSADDNSTVYALLKKNAERTHCPSDTVRSELLCISLVLPPEGIGDIVFAAENYSIRLCKVYSVPAAYTDRGAAISAVFEIGEGDVLGFLCFMRLEYPQFELIGLYTDLR